MCTGSSLAAASRPTGARWIACKHGFFLPVRALSRLFGEFAALAQPSAFTRWVASLRHYEWVVYAKRPFAGPEAVLAYLSRYTHRVAISNRRLVAMDERGVTFRWKDYRGTRCTRR